MFDHAPPTRPSAKRPAPAQKHARRVSAGPQPARGSARPAFHSVRPLPQAPAAAQPAEPGTQPGQPAPPAPAAEPNRTGLPDELKAGVEALTGLSMDDVRVHRNSSEPAKLGALAYAQGSDIHLGIGQEHHLPHEAWHVAQQKQGRVKATAQLRRGVRINDDRGLEAEADRMGSTALAAGPADVPAERRIAADGPLQLAVGFEFQARNWRFYRGEEESDPGRGTPLRNGTGWHLESDGREPEFIVHHHDEATPFTITMNQIANYVGNFRDGYVVNQNQFKNQPRALTVKPAVAENPVTADPQITAGVRFERLSTMISALSQREGSNSLTRANQHLMQNRRAANYSGDDRLLGGMLVAVRRELRQRFPDPPPGPLPPGTTAYDDEQREHVTGLLALLASYLKKAPAVPFWKDFPLLSKSNLAVAVQASPLVTLAGHWLDDPNNADAARDLKEVVLEASGRQADHFVYPPRANERPAGPRCGAWVEGLLVNRVDRLSILTDPDLDPSMGPLNRVDQVADGAAAAPILELRRVNHAMPSTQWAPFVEQVRQWMIRLNDLNEQQLDYQPPA